MPDTPPVNAPERPEVGPYQTVEWSNARNYWLIRDKTTAELAAAFSPPAPTVLTLEDERARMSAYRLSWEDAAAELSLGDGSLLDAIDDVLASVPASQVRRYNNITIFERVKPEIAAYLQNPDAINLPPVAIDVLFRLAMDLETGADSTAQRQSEWASALSEG